MSVNEDDMTPDPYADTSTSDGIAQDHATTAGASEEAGPAEDVGEDVGEDEGLAPHAGPDELFEPADLPPLRAALEAVLLVTDEPVPAVTLAQVVERPTDEVEAVLAELAQEYVETGRGFELRTVAGGWRLYTRADCAPYVERFVLDGQQARLTQAALETLAVIAYRQPVSKARVSAVRGVNVDGVVRTLVARGLVVEAGQDGETGGTLFRTTNVLLEKLGLQSLEDLPSLAPLLPELSDIEFDSTST
ncbi:MAG: SMC-Scp complex subunit ScpB [Mycobacteriales bacterium]|nr:SMC-Scp complex subunit ScpB [Mycobacteriales bacterium]